jgi:MFS family permease
MMHFIKSFLPHHMKRQVKELFVFTTLINFALALVTIFEPIYLYSIGYGLNSIMLFYLMVYVVYFLIIPLGAKFARAKGYELGMFIGSLFFIFFYIALFFVDTYPILFYIAPIIFAIQKTFYWPAYHANFARFSDHKEEGREISAMTVAASVVFIIGPVLAGFIISQWGYGALFTLASVIFIASNIPTLITKEDLKPTKFSYKGAYQDLFSKENRKSFLGYVGFGEELIAVIIWPVFISIVVSNMFDLGLLITATTFITTLAVFYIGKLTDSRNKRHILALGSYIYALSWFFRIFIVSTAGIFFVDTLSRLGKNVIAVPLIALTYEKAKEQEADNKRAVMSRILFFEMALIIGKFIAIIAIYSLTLFIGDEALAFKVTFILAGAMTLLYMLL